jgi:hypothetical protein
MANVSHLNAYDDSNELIFRNCRTIEPHWLHPSERKMLDTIGLRGNETLLEVPKRRRGITSSGFLGTSHKNVFALVETLGGSQVFGFAIDSYFDGILVNGYTHSCWKTPEGELVDVTGIERFSTKFVPFANYKCLTRISPLLNSAQLTSGKEDRFSITWQEIGEYSLIECKTRCDFSEASKIISKNVRDNFLAGFPIGNFAISDNELNVLFRDSSAFSGKTLTEIRSRKQAIIK